MVKAVGVFGIGFLIKTDRAIPNNDAPNAIANTYPTPAASATAPARGGDTMDPMLAPIEIKPKAAAANLTGTRSPEPAAHKVNAARRVRPRRVAATMKPAIPGLNQSRTNPNP